MTNLHVSAFAIESIFKIVADLFLTFAISPGYLFDALIKFV
jgi:hypothetical protein